MSYNAEKMGKLIEDACQSVENRSNGYKRKVIDAIVEILEAERDHKTRRTNIQKKVNEVCHSTGDFLMKERDIDNPNNGGC